jgi:hypothetical protein
MFVVGIPCVENNTQRDGGNDDYAKAMNQVDNHP